MNNLLDSEYVFFQGVARSEATRMTLARSQCRQPAPADPLGSEAFFSDLFRRVGLSGEAYRATSLHRRVPACLRFLGVKDLVAARSKLEKSPGLATELLNVVLLGVTDFWRDPQVFENLARLIPKKPLRIWSAACSEGRELYSVAMLLAEAGQLDKAELIGTDFRPDAIRQAKAGYFPSGGETRLDSSRWDAFLTPFAGGICVAPEIRKRISWRQADLLETTEAGPWDIVLWRNMAIYLVPSAALRVWTAISEQIRPGGLLVTGKAERPPDALRFRRLHPCIYQKP